MEVLLVHPGGPFFRKKDDGSWSIPKGEPNPGEPLLAAARREFIEETGVEPIGRFVKLEPVRQAGGKSVHAFAVEGDLDPTLVRSGTFRLEWPPRSGHWAEFPEVDCAAFFDLSVARRKLNPGQCPLLDQLAKLLAGQ